MWQHFRELKTKPRKGFENTKWLRHFVFWYYIELTQKCPESLILPLGHKTQINKGGALLRLY